MAKRNIKDTYEYKEFQNEKNKMKRWMEIDPFNEKENLKKEILKELSPSENNSISTKPKIFISHTKADEEFANALYNLLKGLGLEDLNIFYSSQRNTGVPVSENIIDTIKNELTHYESIVFIIHSEAYYKSPICLNEMGAAWILNRKIFSFLTKQFNFCDLTGVINKYDICFKTGNKDSNSILDEIILYIQKAFKLEKINVETLDNIKNKFLAKVSIL